MTETTRQIETHINQTREDLGDNLRELGNKVTSLTDWRHQFQKKPMTLIGVAFGGGVLLAAMAAGRKRNRLAGMSPVAADLPHTDPQDRSGRQVSHLPEPWETIKSALVGVVTTRFRHVISDIIPGLEEQFTHSNQGPTPSSPHLASSQAPQKPLPAM